jgi:integrase
MGCCRIPACREQEKLMTDPIIKASSDRVLLPLPKGKFPLSKSGNGQWCKRHHYNYVYFGKDKEEAYNKYVEWLAGVRAGKDPKTARADAEGQGHKSMQVVANAYLEYQHTQYVGNQIEWQTYNDACVLLTSFVKFVGPHTPNGEVTTKTLQKYRTSLIEKRLAPNTINNRLRAVKAMYRWVLANEEVSQTPSLGAIALLATPETQKQTFTAEESRKLIEAADPQMRAMILLGLNCGFGCTDCAEVEWRHFDLVAGYVDFPRPKTHVPRNFELWPDTLAALKALTPRPELGPLVFYTRWGSPWIRPSYKGRGRDDEIGKAFKKVAKRAEVPLEKGNAFYALRRTAATVAAETGDAFAVQRILGHRDLTMASRYVQKRKRRCVNTVRATEHVSHWLHNKPTYESETQVIAGSADEAG